jgi:hypothetical protein
MSIYRLTLAFALIVGIIGCVTNSETPSNEAPDRTGDGKKEEQPKEPEAKKVELKKNIFIETQGDKRRVLVNSVVCNRQTILEQLLTKKGGKEHEAVLAADIDARDLHTVLMVAGAEPGTTVVTRPKFMPPTGTTIKIFLEYEKDGKKVRVRAQEWVRNIKTKKELHTDWVFAGSHLIPDPFDKAKKPKYAANFGDVICISNFDTALLDVPFDSPKDNDDLTFETNTDKIPPEKTAVLVILEPVIEKKKK